MSEDFDEWNPMREDFNSFCFNSYSRGPGVQLSIQSLPNFNNHKFSHKSAPNLKLFLEGFSSELTEFGLKSFLESIGCKPFRVKVIHPKSRLGKPFGFVDFESKSDASKAFELINTQKIYKLFVTYASNKAEKEAKEEIIKKEKEYYAQHLFKMKPKISLDSRAINSNSNNNNNSISPIRSSSDSSSGDASLSDVISSLANSNKLLKVLQEADSECSFCNEPQKVEHIHYILSDQQVLDPSQVPDLIDLSIPLCVMCGKKDGDLKLCSQCRIATYCSIRCQRSNWPKHSLSCRPNINGISQLNAFIPSHSFNSVPNSEPILKMVQTPNTREQPKESTPLSIDVNVGRKEKINGNIDVIGAEKESSLLQISTETTSENKSTQMEKQTLPISHSPNMRSTKVKLKIVPFKGDILYEELVDGEDDVIICFGRNPSDFYVQKGSCIDKINLLTEQLLQKQSDFPQLADKDLRIDSLCGGIYAVDDTCYRAKIVDKVDDNTYALHFIDYGNTESVHKKDIKALPQIFFDCKAQAIHCSLANIKPSGDSWDKNAINFFGKLGEENRFTKVRIFEKSNEDIYKIDLLDTNGVSMIDQLVDKNFASISSKADTTTSKSLEKSLSSLNESLETSPEVTPKKAMPQNSPKVIFNMSSLKNKDFTNSFRAQEKPIESSVEDSAKLDITPYLDSLDSYQKVTILVTDRFDQNESQYWGILNIDKYTDLTEKIKSEYPKAYKRDASKGDFVVVKASDDDFYRSYVIDVRNAKADVLMIDTGFHETVTEIYPLSSKFTKFAALAVLLIPETDEAESLLDLYFRKETASFEGIILKQNDDFYIKANGQQFKALNYKSAIDLITKTGDSSKTVDPISQLSSLKLDLNKRIEGLVLFQEVENRSIFYIAGDADGLQEVMSECALHSSQFKDEMAVNPIVGKTYLAKHSDGDWYRAFILSAEENNYEVLFVDFGNRDKIDPKFVMSLPSSLDLNSSPAVAVKCEVNSSDMELEAVHKKIEKAADGTYLLKIEAIKYENGVHFVNVY